MSGLQTQEDRRLPPGAFSRRTTAIDDPMTWRPRGSRPEPLLDHIRAWDARFQDLLRCMNLAPDT